MRRIGARIVGGVVFLVTRTTAFAAAARPNIVSSVGAIAEQYDAILLDQFGVLHDGVRALPGAIECFDELASRQKKLIVLSNTSRRRAFALKKFPSLGFSASSLTGFITSGEAAWQHILDHCAGQRMLWLSWSESFQAWDPTYLDGLDVSLAPAESADFILCQGSHDLRDGVCVQSGGVFSTGRPSAALDKALRSCVARGLPMICVCKPHLKPSALHPSCHVSCLAFSTLHVVLCVIKPALMPPLGRRTQT